MGALLGFMAMAIDLGLFFEDRRHFQNSADAMALAGVAELPINPVLARQKAEDWGANNGVDAADIQDIEVRTTSYPNDTLFVELEGDFTWMFGRAVGMTNSKVGAQAAARIGSFAGGHDMMPWSILQGDSDCLDAQGAPLFAASCSVKVGAQSSFGGGWRGALDLDGQGGGANEYRDNIVDGQADTYYCIDGQLVPPCQTSIVDIKTGNMVGPTEQGLEGHLAAGPKCDANSNGKDDFDEVFKPTGQVSPAYTVACSNSPWLVIIPIVEYTGGDTVNIKGWALSYVKAYGCVDSSASRMSEQSVVFGGRSIATGAVGWDPTATLASKACNHNTQAQQAAPAEDSLVMAIEPGAPLPAGLRGLAAPPACHQGTPHGQQQCATSTPTPAPTPTATQGPTSTPGGTPTPSPAPSGNCNGQGHYEVQVQIADATYSQVGGFLGAFDPASGIAIRRLVE
jgi:hypothetical protein